MRRMLLTGLCAIVLSSAGLAQSSEGFQEVTAGLQLLNQNDLDGAERVLSKLAEQGGDRGLSGTLALYQVFERRGRIKEGVQLFRSAYARTRDIRYLTGGGNLLTARGQRILGEELMAPAVELLKQGSVLPPQAAYLLATALRRLNDVELSLKAARMAEDGYRAEGRNTWVAVGLLVADILEDAGRTLEAFDEFEFLLQNGPENASVMNNYAYHLAIRGKELQRALGMVEKARVLSPTSAPIMDTQGFILFKLGRNEEAIDALVKAWRRQPASTVARQHLAQALAKRPGRSPALQSLLDALRTEPNPQNTAEIERLLTAIGE